MSNSVSLVRAVRRILSATAGLVLSILATTALAQPARLEPDQLIRFSDAEGRVIDGGVWLPSDFADGPARPLVVMSHGNGGWFKGHSDTARALADAGMVVAALTHPGDNYLDQSGSIRLTDRAPQLSALIDHMTGDWSGSEGIDPARIGAFGFSAGGFTVTSIIGGEADGSAILEHCEAYPELFACRLIVLMGGIDLGGWRPEARDPRVDAAVIAAPALGYAFTDDSLSEVSIPVQLWQAEGDDILPAPFNVEPIRDGLGRAPEYHRVSGAGHYDFLQPCTLEMRVELPQLCASEEGFDRAAFKATFNAEVVRFFREALGVR
jgi:predicted dienelactone hydrolase